MDKINFNYHNIDYILCNTNKYKSIYINIMFIRPIEKEDITYYSLLNNLLATTTKKYNTKKALANKLEELYASSIYFQTDYSYKTAFSSFKIKMIESNLVNDDSLMSEIKKLIYEVIFNPNVDNGMFNQKDFDEEKRSLSIDIKNTYNNKSNYCYLSLLKMIDNDGILGASALGDIDILNTITPNSLYNFYLKMLDESKVIIGGIGNISKDDLIYLTSNLNLNSNNSLKFISAPLNIEKLTQPNIKEEHQDIKQAKLMMGFVYDINRQDENHIPLLLFNAMFGEMFSSSLFKIIREKYSLTYDIYSDILLNRKLLIVSGGFGQKNIDKGITLILEILNDYKKGNIDINLLNVAKDYLINNFLETNDSKVSYLNSELKKVVFNTIDDDEFIKKIKNCTIDDIKRVSNMIYLHSIFKLLPGVQNE